MLEAGLLCQRPVGRGHAPEIGTITLPESALQLLTFHYGKGNNFAYFEFVPVDEK
jgi:hypothetical protein